jgi:CIC family chloride channel protein
VDVDAPVASIAVNRSEMLSPDEDIGAIMRDFDATGSDELAVVDDDRRVLGILSESYVRRRYAEELEKAQRDLFGER